MIGATPLLRRDLRAMNTDIELWGRGERQLERAERWLQAYEQRLSRFLPYSELSRLNASAGRPFKVSPLLFAQLEAALRLADRSGGLFDPTVLNHLQRAGYDRSFEILQRASSIDPPLRQQRAGWRQPGGEVVRPSFQDVRLDPTTRTITLPPGLGIDLGGIGKGWAVDRVATMLGTPCLVNAGGDIFAAGQPPGEDAWRVGIEDPLAPDEDIAVLAVADRGVATSSTVRRRWVVAGEQRHHLIDPRTGASAQTDVLTATVVAPTTTLADLHAKVALLKGSAAGLGYLKGELDVEGLLILHDGAVLTSTGMDAYLTWQREPSGRNAEMPTSRNAS